MHLRLSRWKDNRLVYAAGVHLHSPPRGSRSGGCKHCLAVPLETTQPSPCDKQVHARGRPLARLRPSMLRIAPGGVVFAAPVTAAPGEDALYASPEELLNGNASAASDVYSLGVLFFELFNPVVEPGARARALGDLRHRILPLPMLQGRQQEAAFLLALLHPDPTARPKVNSPTPCICPMLLLALIHVVRRLDIYDVPRPSASSPVLDSDVLELRSLMSVQVVEIARSSLLAALHRSIVGGQGAGRRGQGPRDRREPGTTQTEDPTPSDAPRKDGAEADRDVLIDFLRLLRRTKVWQGFSWHFSVPAAGQVSDVVSSK